MRYAVMIGDNDTQGFRSLPRAKLFAQRLANKSGKKVVIDKITDYPNAKVGETDWSQGFLMNVSPKKQALKTKVKKKMMTKKSYAVGSADWVRKETGL